MASLVKYRIHEVAKDFGWQTKDVSNIVAEFYEKPKNHMQVLEDDQLNLIFDYITYNNQIDSIETVFAEAAKAAEPEKPVEAEKPAEKPVEKAPGKPADKPAPRPQSQGKPQQGQRPAPQGQGQNRDNRRDQGRDNRDNRDRRPDQPRGQQGQRPPQQGQRPAPQGQGQGQSKPQQNAPQQSAAPQPKQPQPQRQRERRVVDTSAATVNVNRFDDRVEDLIPGRAQNMAQNSSKGKEKIGKTARLNHTVLVVICRFSTKFTAAFLQRISGRKNPLRIVTTWGFCYNKVCVKAVL